MTAPMVIRRDVAFVSCFLCLTAAACGNLIDMLKGGAGADAGVDAAVVSGSGIANEADITRYVGEETPVSGEAKTLRATIVHSTYPGTDIVATLPADTSVIEMATHAGGVLIVFEHAGSQKMGWIDESVVPPIVATEELAADATAPTPATNNNSKAVANRDAGAVKVVDAGAVKVVDAGPAKVVDAGPAKVVDAGPAKVVDAGGGGGTARIVIPLPASGKCASGYTRFPTDSQDCRKLCTTDANCSGAKCVEKGTKKTKMCYSK